MVVLCHPFIPFSCTSTALFFGWIMCVLIINSMKWTYKEWETVLQRNAAVNHTFRKVLAVFQQLLSVCRSPLAPVLNPLNQNSYNNFWSLSAWLSTMEDVFIDSQRWRMGLYKISISTLFEITCALFSELKGHDYGEFTFIHSFILLYIFSRHVL